MMGTVQLDAKVLSWSISYENHRKSYTVHIEYEVTKIWRKSQRVKAREQFKTYQEATGWLVEKVGEI
ncbi:MAG: hypothetical protein ACK5MU_04095 [Candidatus Saccharimonadales bacterium]